MSRFLPIAAAQQPEVSRLSFPHRGPDTADLHGGGEMEGVRPRSWGRELHLCLSDTEFGEK